ncbi:MFS transporter [Synechococcus sp. PCC 6312]|uniref:MFS transporter n=1 Tax=Synechococcus sp. (strain ATCC 27167 / PCC 6312) TaxID=195253 RepID=UPI00029ED8DA|nr:MFS transporter [Synechococcus sp. PCC 6312]AFY61086.1 arabinose efflux permease family protein [Synechococcus sp. PCC 6312]
MESILPKSLQAHIDESPPRPLTPMQWRIWALAAMGKFFEGMVIFITGVALPLLERYFDLPAALDGSLSAATLFGILVGASLFGNLADRLGRKFVFVWEMALFTLFLVLCTLAWNIGVLIVALFCVGLALGADYPTAHIIVSESIPSKFRGRMVLGAFAFQSVGSLGGVLLGLAVLKVYPQVEAWRWMYAALIGPGLIVFLLRLTLAESAHWLLARGRIEEAHRAAQRLLKRPVAIDRGSLSLNIRTARPGFRLLFSPRYFQATILAAVPWFLQDLSTYGIGIFTPTILATLFTRTSSNFIFQDMVAAEGSGVIDLFLLFGFLTSLPLVDKVGRIPLQILGFGGCAVGLLIASFAADIPDGHELKIFLIFAGFMIFNFMNNLGPNAMTYLLAGEVFPTEIRGLGAGFAASFAKIGAVLTAFFFPILREQIGTTPLLYILSGTAVLGGLITFVVRIEPNGKSLEELA